MSRSTGIKVCLRFRFPLDGYGDIAPSVLPTISIAELPGIKQALLIFQMENCAASPPNGRIVVTVLVDKLTFDATSSASLVQKWAATALSDQSLTSHWAEA
jgi:hypothetical protein